MAGVTLSPYGKSPLQSTRLLVAHSPYHTPDSATHKLTVPAPTPSAVDSPCSSPLLSVRHCLPLPASPMSEVRKLPCAPPSSPAISVADRLARSSAFKELMQQQATQAEERDSGHCKDEHSLEEEDAALSFTSSDEKRHSLSSNSGSRRGVEWMPVLVE